MNDKEIKPDGNGDSCSLDFDIFNSPSSSHHGTGSGVTHGSSTDGSTSASSSDITSGFPSSVTSLSDLKPIVTPDGAMFYTLSDSLYPNNSISFDDAKEFCEAKGMILPIPKDWFQKVRFTALLSSSETSSRFAQTINKSAAENYLIWIEKEKTSEQNLEFIWLGIEQINSKWINIYTKEEISYNHWEKDEGSK